MKYCTYIVLALLAACAPMTELPLLTIQPDQRLGCQSYRVTVEDNIVDIHCAEGKKP